MIKHIVMFRFKDKTTVHQAKAAIESLRGKIPGLIRLEVGVDLGGDAAASDLVLYSEFEDLAALQSYATHPAHTPVKRLVAELASERRTVDYED